jgi:hypothetical protein
MSFGLSYGTSYGCRGYSEKNP